jgi:hypothetical protein
LGGFEIVGNVIKMKAWLQIPELMEKLDVCEK